MSKVHIVIGKRAKHLVRPKEDLAPKRMRDNSAKYVARVREANEAHPNQKNIWSEGHYDGAELKPFEGRPGSMDAFYLPSLGVAT
jgi:hypothetical protein